MTVGAVAELRVRGEETVVEQGGGPALARENAWERTLPGPGGSLIRYALIESAVTGKRVLDIGCGDGTGSRQLLARGALAVVGIDPSPEAIACARRAGGGDLSFHVGQLDQLDSIVAEKGPFHVIVCYSGATPPGRIRPLISSIVKRRMPGTLLVTSGDLAEAGPPTSPHASAFQTMRELYDSALGKPGKWFVAAQAAGQFAVPVAFWDNVATNSDSAAALLRTLPIKTLLLPLPVAADGCPPPTWSHYIGVWGEEFAPVAMIGASQAAEAVAPDISADTERLHRLINDPKAYLHAGDGSAGEGQSTRRELRLEAQIVEMRQRVQYYAARTSSFPYQVAVLEDRVRELERALQLVERSFGYRLLQAARRLYRVPLLGVALGLARRSVGAVVRSARALASR